MINYLFKLIGASRVFACDMTRVSFCRGEAWPRDQSIWRSDDPFPSLPPFLQGVSIACYAEPCFSYDRVVRLSVTRWQCTE